MPTQQDADLILRLYDLRRDEKMRAARDWFVRNARPGAMEDFRNLCPPGSQENAYFRQVTSFWDMAASFVISGLLDPELFFQSNRELLLVWARVEGVASAYREAMKDPTAFRNIEAVARQFISWMDQQHPEMYTAFASRIK
jgi:hypothetical protein